MDTLKINDNEFNEDDFGKPNQNMKMIDMYFEEQNKYTKLYDDKTVVFFEMGKFYEAYYDGTRGFKNLDVFEDMLSIKYIRRDVNDKIKNPYKKPSQFGIPLVAIKNKMDILIENFYTVVLFNQVTKNDKITREFAGVFSKGTYISENKKDDANNIISVYISEEQQLFGKSLLAIGVTILDITTGKSTIHEFCSNKNDEKFGLDELIRIFESFKPTESIVYYHPRKIDQEIIKSIKTYIEIDKYKCEFYVYTNDKQSDKLNLLHDDCFKISYQNKFLSEIFLLNDQINLRNASSPLEILYIEETPYIRISLMIILNFIKNHNTSLLKNLSYPDMYIYNQHLILGNNARSELNIIDSNNLDFYNKKFTSVYDVINHTSTPMGKRYLKNNLTNPLSQQNKKKIITRYEIIEELIKTNLYTKLKQDLKCIYDVERLHRKMAVGIITPYDFYRLDIYYHTAIKIIMSIKDNEIINKLITKKTIDNIIKFQSKINKELIFDELKEYTNYNNITKSFFKRNVYEDLDDIQDKIDYAQNIINTTKTYFTDLISDDKKKTKSAKDIIEQEYNENDKIHFTLTKSNAKILENKLKQLSGKNKKTDLKFSKDDITFKILQKGRTKIFVRQLKESTDGLNDNIELMSKIIKEKFLLKIEEYYKKFKHVLNDVCNFITELDFLVSGASVAKAYHYCKPEIESKNTVPSYIIAKGLRHPIIERLCTETEYIPNDIELGNVPDCTDKNGVLLYGLNSAGKSSFMKSIGIAIILAQIGYYVPANKFSYEPYMAIYARITGNDNLFKGLSCFALEMTELNAILTRTETQGENTLVIGDEVCRGTEKTSELALVAASIVTFSGYSSSFIFSSHLHKLAELDEIKDLTNLRLYHMRVEYSEEKDCLIFDRKLTVGPGPTCYGLTVAKYYIRHTNFLLTADKIKKKMTHEEKFDIPVKKSKYNKNLIVKSCQICYYSPKKNYHKELHTHHINFQSDCLSDGKIKSKPYLHKNMLANLVVLCDKCHNKVHRNEILIKGYSDTSIGPLLDYKRDIKQIIKNYKI